MPLRPLGASLGASLAVAAVLLTGCAADVEDEPRRSNIPVKQAAEPSGPDSPGELRVVAKALGANWSTSPEAPETMLLCGTPAVPDLDAPERFTDPDGRVVTVGFVSVEDDTDFLDGLRNRLDDSCSVFVDDSGQMFYAWADPARATGDGVAGHTVEGDFESEETTSGTSLAAAPAGDDWLVVVQVEALDGDDPNLEVGPVYADLIAKNQLDANGGTEVDPVPSFADVKSPVDTDAGEEIIPPVGPLTEAEGGTDSF